MDVCWQSLLWLAAAGAVEYQSFLGKFFLAKPRSSSGYSLAADKKQLRIGAGSPTCPLATCMSHCSCQVSTVQFVCHVCAMPGMSVSRFMTCHDVVSVSWCLCERQTVFATSVTLSELIHLKCHVFGCSCTSR